MRILKRILIVIGSFFLLLFLSAFIILKYYEEDVVNYTVDKAKSQFTTKVELGKVELVFWKTFPHASLHVTDLYIEETFPTMDTLIYAKSVFLEFSLMDLFRGKYDIRSISVDNALCQFVQNKSGEDNWHFWMTDASDTSQLSMNLQKVKIERTRVIYEDRRSELYLDLTSEKSTGRGNFTGKQFDLNLDLAGKLNRLISGKERYAVDKNFRSEANISADTDKNIYRFNKCEIRVEKLPFMINGFVDASEKSSLHLKINGQGLDLSKLVESLTENQRASLKDYAPSGDINLDISIIGDSYGNKKPLVEVHGVMRDGRLKHRPSGTVLDNLSWDIRYSTGKKSDQLRVNQMACTLESGFMKVDGTVDELSAPVLNLNVESQIDLNALKKFFALDTLEICQGNIFAKARISGALKYAEGDSSYDWHSLLTSGSAQLEGGLLRLKNSNREFNGLTGEILFDKKDVSIQHFGGKVNGSDFKIDGTLKNLIPFLSSTTDHLQLDARMYCTLIDFTNLVETESSTSNNNAYKFELPERIEFRLQTEIGKFVFRKFEAKEMKGVVFLNNGKLTIDPVSFNTSDGKFKAQIMMERSSEDLYRMNCLASLDAINIQTLFTEFENFGQTFIQDKHIKGTATATVQLRTSITTSLEVLSDKVESIIDISILNGELNNVETLQDIAGYIKSNNWVAPFVNEDKFAEKMKNISFSKLENVIEIKNRLVTIPLMDIRSSAMDISARGTHTFDNGIDYAIGFNLRDVLVKKEREWKEADDGLGKRLYLSMKGTTDKPVFGMDKELAKSVRQDEMQEEKQNVKALLKQELGLFKKSSSVGTYKEEKPPQGAVTTMQWDDDGDPQIIMASEKSQPADKEAPVENAIPEPKKKVPKWLKEKQ